MKLTTEQMLEKFSNSSSHPCEVRRLSMMIFDGVNDTLREMSNKQRKYLEEAALLHDIGYFIDSYFRLLNFLRHLKLLIQLH